jgi:hypothetical protein
MSCKPQRSEYRIAKVFLLRARARAFGDRRDTTVRPEEIGHTCSGLRNQTGQEQVAAVSGQTQSSQSSTVFRPHRIIVEVNGGSLLATSWRYGFAHERVRCRRYVLCS